METNSKGAALKKLILHYVGSKNNLDALQLSQKEQALEKEILQIIGDSFLTRFNTAFEYYQFGHTSSLQYNEVYSYAAQIFEDHESLEDASVNIAKHLYNSSTHPKVKGGELYVCFFEGLPVEGRIYAAIGLFKTENKSLFLDAAQGEGSFELGIKEGVELGKMDKGCLIINTKKEEGFDVLIFDNQNRSEEALYWKETFLGLLPQKNEFHQTNHLLTLTKQFITQELNEDAGVTKTEQIDLLSKSLDYFKSNASFDIDEFQTNVFGHDDRIEGFRSFGSRYIEKNDFDITANFDISPQAVKKQARVYKSVLKLDKNFHIYIHGNTDLIERGTDDDGRKYYKIYYQQEA